MSILKNMKAKLNLLSIVLFSFLLTSCASTSYYQVYQVTPSNEMTESNNQIIYEDDNCMVFYNLWSEGGDIGFQFYNKTNKTIEINMEKSYFILNGIAYDYFKNRTLTKAQSSGAKAENTATASRFYTKPNLLNANKLEATKSAAVMSSSSVSVAYEENKIINIPPKSAKVISEYSINDLPYRDCDLYRYPSATQIKNKYFSKNDSPLVFSNRINYNFQDTKEVIEFENEFYVSEIANYPERHMYDYEQIEKCGQKSMNKERVFKDVSSSKFYIQYYKGNNTWIH